MVARSTSPPHGTRARYVHRVIRCRCAECKAANASYHAAYRAAPPAESRPIDPRHGAQLQLFRVRRG